MVIATVVLHTELTGIETAPPLLGSEFIADCIAEVSSVESSHFAPNPRISTTGPLTVIRSLVVVVPFAAKVENVPAAAVVAPIGVPLIVPPVMTAPEEARLLAVRLPVASMVRAVVPAATTCKGLRVEPVAVVTFKR